MAHAGDSPEAGERTGARTGSRARGGSGGRRLPVLTESPGRQAAASGGDRGLAHRRAAALVRLHEALCFLQAYPDDREILGRVDGLLRDFPARIRRLGPRAEARLQDSGIAGSALEYPYGLPLSRWLAARVGAHADIGWAGIPDTEKIADALDLLVTPSESDAFSEGGFTVRRWLEVARAGRRLTDLQVLVEAFDRAPLDPGLRDWLYESLGVPVRVRLAAPGVSRTMAKRPVERPVFQRVPLRRAGVDVVREATRPLPSLRRASPALAGELIETARVAMVTRSRELHAFSYPNVEDVLVGEAGRGLRVVLIGLQPPFRLPFEGYYAFLAIRNGVPVSYGGGWCLFETLEFGFNVFESFRQGESAWILGQALRAYHQVFGMRTVVVDPYQLGAGNPEALRSGAFYFYQHLGFRPRTDAVRRVLEEELGRDRSRPAVPVAPLGAPAAGAGGGLPHAARRQPRAGAPSAGTRSGRAGDAGRRAASRRGPRGRHARRDAPGGPRPRGGAAGRVDGRRAPGVPPVGSRARAGARPRPVVTGEPGATREDDSREGRSGRGTLRAAASRSGAPRPRARGARPPGAAGIPSGSLLRPVCRRRGGIPAAGGQGDAGDDDQGADHVGPGHGLAEEEPRHGQHLERDEVHA